jgi:hypothetical protein
MTGDMKTLRERLAAPFADADIDWRLQHNDEEKGRGVAVPYVTNRAIQTRLDDCVDPCGWKNEFLPWHGDGKKSAQLCGLSLWSDERGEWITKYDGADDSDIESVKGGLSDAMKRAAVEWSIGRYLYGMDTVFVDTEKRGRTAVIKRSERAKLDRAHGEHVAAVFKTGKKPPAQAAPKADAPPAGTAPNTTPKEAKGEAVVYTVENVARKPALNGGVNTSLMLSNGEGKTALVHLKGEDPALAPGARIKGAKISKKTKEGVLFLILESYDAVQEAA